MEKCPVAPVTYSFGHFSIKGKMGKMGKMPYFGRRDTINGCFKLMSRPMTRPVGRPTKYRDSIVRAICIRLMIGESLNKICQLDNYPKKATVFRWLLEKPEFKDKYQHAREMQQEHYLDEIMEIADDSSDDYIETERGPTLDREHVQRSKLRIETRRWTMERLAVRRYGDKKQVDHTSSDESMSPKTIEISDDQLNRVMQKLDDEY